MNARRAAPALRVLKGDGNAEIVERVRRLPEPSPEAVAESAALFERASAADGKTATLGDAEQLYRRSVRLNPREPASWTNLGNCRYWVGDHREAEQCYLMAIALRPACPDANCNLGVLLFERGHVWPALHHLRAALRSDPGLPEALYAAARAYAIVRAFPRARATCERFLLLRPRGRDATDARKLLKRLRAVLGGQP